jgi:3-deoxy-D-manno-octulosonate 8-phosphate phosphatase (KDO 8-P phosphatase)
MSFGLENVAMVFFDFDGVFTDNRVLISEDGKESVLCYRSDGVGLSKLKKAGVDCMVVSSEPNPVVSIRCQKLNIECIQGVRDKLTVIKQILEEKKIEALQCVFVGNDDGDLGAMRFVGIPVAVADAYPHIKDAARIILTRDGGRGAVREICELIVSAKGNHA